MEYILKGFLDSFFDNYFKKRTKNLILLFCFYSMGLFAGSVLFNQIGADFKDQFELLFSKYLTFSTQGGLSLNSLFFDNFIQSLSFLSLLLLTGFFLMIGIPINFFLLFYKGFTVGFSAIFILSLNEPMALEFFISHILIFNLFLAPCLLLFSSDCMAFSLTVISYIKGSRIAERGKFFPHFVQLLSRYFVFIIFSVIFSFIFAAATFFLF